MSNPYYTLTLYFIMAHSVCSRGSTFFLYFNIHTRVVVIVYTFLLLNL